MRGYELTEFGKILIAAFLVFLLLLLPAAILGIKAWTSPSSIQPHDNPTDIMTPQPSPPPLEIDDSIPSNHSEPNPPNTPLSVDDEQFFDNAVSEESAVSDTSTTHDQLSDEPLMEEALTEGETSDGEIHPVREPPSEEESFAEEDISANEIPLDNIDDETQDNSPQQDAPVVRTSGPSGAGK